jgi:hypothetical protein
VSILRTVAALLLFAAPVVLPPHNEQQDPATSKIAMIMQRRSSNGEIHSHQSNFSNRLKSSSNNVDTLSIFAYYVDTK